MVWYLVKHRDNFTVAFIAKKIHAGNVVSVTKDCADK